MRLFTGTPGKHSYQGGSGALGLPSPGRRLTAGLLVLGMVFAAMVLTAADALADIRVTAESTFPTETQVGDQNIPFRFTVENISSDPDRGVTLRLDEAGVIPACAEYQGGVCVSPELGVFDIRTGPAAAVGVGGSCDGVTFTVEEPDAQGRYRIVPNQEVLLGPSDGTGAPRLCIFELLIEEVSRTPDADARPNEPGIQTENQIDVVATDPNTARTTRFARTDLVTVFAGEVAVATLSDPNQANDPMPVPPGTTSTDTATVSPINPGNNTPDPTGDVFFQLIGPDPDATCTGPVAFESGPRPIDPATGEAVSEESPPLQDPGLYNWVATFESGDNNYSDITEPQGCGDDRERFQVQPAPTVAVDKTVDPDSREEPGGVFTYFVEVTNTGVNPVTITSLTDDVYGDLNDPNNPNVQNNTCDDAVGTPLAPGETYSCQFDGEFLGVAGDTETDIITVTVQDEFGQQAEDDDDAVVTITPPADITVEIVKTADPESQPEPGGDFTFDVLVTNTTDRPVEITSLTDDVYGDLNDPANPDVTDNTCEGAVGTPLAASPGPGNTFACSFVGEFTGVAGDTETDTVTVVVEDAQGREAEAEDDATVEITPPLDIVVAKTADPTSLPEPGGTFTFTVEVTNPTDRRLAITALTDDVYGDLDDPDNPEVENNTCLAAVGTVLEPGDTFTCTFEGEFTGVAGDTETDTVTVVGEDEDGRQVQDEDDATVTITPPPEIRVDKTVDPTSLPEPGGTFTFTVVVLNTSDGPLTITSLDDDVYGDLNDPNNPDVENNTCEGVVGTVLDPNETFTCTFDGEFTGDAGDSETDTVTVVSEDEDGREVTDEDDATVTITAPPGAPTVLVDKVADPATRPAPGGDFTFTVLVTNTSPDREVTITSLTDDIYGDLNDPANPNVTDNTCTDAVGTILAASPGPGHTYTCTFVGEFTGVSGDTETDVVTVVVEDDDGREARDDDDAVITLTGEILPTLPKPPPPPPPPPPVPAAQPLPRTGADMMLAVALGMAMVMGGLMLVRAAPAGATPGRRRGGSGLFDPR